MLIKRGLQFCSAWDLLSRYVCFIISARFLATLDSWSNAAVLRFYTLHKFTSTLHHLFSLMFLCFSFFYVHWMKNGGGDQMITPLSFLPGSPSESVPPFVGFLGWRCIPSVTAVWRPSALECCLHGFSSQSSSGLVMWLQLPNFPLLVLLCTLITSIANIIRLPLPPFIVIVSPHLSNVKRHREEISQ